jgi:hypothetical protein
LQKARGISSLFGRIYENERWTSETV